MRQKLLHRLADDLAPRLGRGFGWRNLTQMRAFFLASCLSRLGPESHALRKCPTMDEEERARYIWLATSRDLDGYMAKEKLHLLKFVASLMAQTCTSFENRAERQQAICTRNSMARPNRHQSWNMPALHEYGVALAESEKPT